MRVQMNFKQKYLEGVREKMTIQLMEGKISQVWQLNNDILITNKHYQIAKTQKKREIYISGEKDRDTKRRK